MVDRGWWTFLMLASAAAIIGWVLVIKVFASAAAAHDWYPISCCSGGDCAPAEVEVLPTQSLAAMGISSALPSLMRVFNQHGSVIVPADFQTRMSPDGRVHACIHNGRLICLFIPPST
jgi:hypothetical protein